MSLSSDLSDLKGFSKRIGLKAEHAALAAVLAVGVAVFEALTVALLVPLARGVLAMDFGFVRDMPGLGPMFGWLSSWVKVTNSVAFVIIIGLVFAASLAKNIFQYGALVSVAFIMRRFANNTRKLIFRRCLTFGKAYLDQTNAGHLHGLLMNTTNTIAFRLRDMQDILSCALMLLAYLAMMLTISWKLTVFVLFVFPILGYSLNWLIDRIKRSSAAFAAAEAELNRKIFNVLSCLPLVKSYGMEDHESDRFNAASDVVERYEFSIVKKLNLVTPLQEVIMLAMILLLVSAMAVIASRNGPSVLPGFVVFFYAIRRAGVSFGVLNNAKASFATISGPIEEVRAILADEDKAFMPSGAIVFEGVKKGIELRNLTHSFIAGRPVLKGVNLKIERGTMTALVGPSGAGKSTLISMLVRFYDCKVGSILVDGVDIRDFDIGSVRKKFALVSQDTMLFHDTLRANITYGLGTVPESKLELAIRKARLEDFVKSQPAGLDIQVGDRGIQLSGGEKQRVSIARALLKEAELLVLDEATSSLDSRTEKLIQEAIDEMLVGKTAVVIAHRLSTIKRADKIVVLEDGRVAEAGPLVDLLASKGRLYQYWEEQKFS